MERDFIIITTPQQLHQVENEYEFVRSQTNDYIDVKKYKKAYTLLSKFLNKYDCHHQIHPIDRTYFYNLLFSLLTRIFSKHMIRDLSKKNIIEVKIHQQKSNLYAKILKVLINKVFVNLSYSQMDVKAKTVVTDDVNKQIFLDQGLHSNRGLKQQNFRLRQMIVFLDIKYELELYLSNTQKCFKYFSIIEQQSINYRIQYGQISYEISKLLLLRKKNLIKDYIVYVNSTINYYLKLYEINDEQQCEQLINEINHSKIIDALGFLIEKIENKNKNKQKYKIRLQKLLRQLVWFYLQQLYYYQQKMNFQKCYETTQLCKWLVYYFLKQDEEFTIYVFSISQSTFLPYKIATQFNSLVMRIIDCKEFGFPILKQIMIKNSEQYYENKRHRNSLEYHYNSQIDVGDIPANYIPSRPQIKISKQSNELCFIEQGPLENISSVDTHQSSRTYRDRIKSQKLQCSSKMSRGSIIRNSIILNSYNEQATLHKGNSLTQPDQQQVPILDKIIKKMVDNKINIKPIENEGEELLQQQALSHKENNFYKRLCQFKQDFNKLRQPIKRKSNQEVVNSIMTKETIFHKKRIQEESKSSKSIQKIDDPSLLSFEKPGVKLTGLEKLKKIIFSHPEVFSLTKLRNRLKQQNQWFNRGHVRHSTSKRTQLFKRQLSEAQTQENLVRLRQRSQIQLMDNLSKTENRLNEVNKSLSMCRLRHKSLKKIDEPQIIHSDYQSLCRSIAYQKQNKQ